MKGHRSAVARRPRQKEGGPSPYWKLEVKFNRMKLVALDRDRATFRWGTTKTKDHKFPDCLEERTCTKLEACSEVAETRQS